jgi:hypothetical protein
MDFGDEELDGAVAARASVLGEAGCTDAVEMLDSDLRGVAFCGQRCEFRLYAEVSTRQWRQCRRCLTGRVMSILTWRSGGTASAMP